MYYVYVLKSLEYCNQMYIGSTFDLDQRLQMHNRGQCIHTAKYLPWKIISYIAVEDKVKALSVEQYLKSGSGRAFLAKRLL